MKPFLKKSLLLSVALGLSLQVVGPAAFAEDAIVLDPKTVRSHLLRSNSGIIAELNQLQIAKDRLNIARMSLLPSVNINLVGFMTGGPSFFLSAVNFLLPFLLPQNWFNLGKNEALLGAEKQSFYLLELNAYASAYALYATHVTDTNLRTIALNQYKNYERILKTIEAQNVIVGGAQEGDVLNARAQLQLAEASLSKIDELLIQEKANLRAALGINLEDQISVTETHLGASPAERLSLGDLASQATSIAPEFKQLSYLIQGAEYDRWTAMFGWLTGATLAAQPTVSGGVSSVSSLSGFTQTTTMNLGFAIFPQIQLASDNIQQLELRKKEISLEEARISESSLGSVKEAQKQYAAATLAEGNFTKLYEIELKKYELGLTDLLHVYAAYNTVVQASTTKLKAQADLDLLRISLNRVLISGEFDVIPGCALTAEAKAQFEKSWIEKIFGGDDDNLGVDGICKPNLED